MRFVIRSNLQRQKVKKKSNKRTDETQQSQTLMIKHEPDSHD